MNIKELEDKRIAVLLSGGVDSSVVVYELARLGLHPDCFYIKINDQGTVLRSFFPDRGTRKTSA